MAESIRSSGMGAGVVSTWVISCGATSLAGLGEMHFVARPEGLSFLGIARVEVIGGVDQLASQTGLALAANALASSSGSNWCSQMRRKVVTAGSVFIQSGVVGVSMAASSIQPSAPT